MGEVQWGRTGLCFGDSRRTSSRTFAGAIRAEPMGFVFLFCCWSTFPTVRKPAAWPWGEAGTEDMMSGLRRGRRARGGLWLGGWHPPPCPQHCLHLLPVVSKHPGFKCLSALSLEDCQAGSAVSHTNGHQRSSLLETYHTVRPGQKSQCV